MTARINFPNQAFWVKPVEDIFESLPHGATLTKFVAVDAGNDDFAVTIHGFVDSRGRLVITHENFINKRDNDEADR